MLKEKGKTRAPEAEAQTKKGSKKINRVGVECPQLARVW